MARVLAAAELPREALCTYAALWTASRTGLSFSVEDLRMFAPVEHRSIQRHTSALEHAGLIVRWQRLGERAQLPNEYILLFHPAMPEELRGPAYTAGVLLRSGADVVRRDDADVGRGHDADVGGEDGTGDALPMTSASGDHKDHTIPIQHADDATSEADGDEVPAPLREALQRAAPRQSADVFRVLREECCKLPPERRRPLQLLALRKLIQRCEIGEVRNPAGLLRGHLLSDAGEQLDGVLASCVGLRAEIADCDARITRAANGFSFQQLMRDRAAKVRAYVRLHVEVHGGEPADVPRLAVEDPGLREVVAEVERLLELTRAARLRDDGMAINQANGRLQELERTLNVLLRCRHEEPCCEGESVVDAADTSAEERVRQSEQILQALRSRMGAPSEPQNVPRAERYFVADQFHARSEDEP
jgi:hypothetical protein